MEGGEKLKKKLVKYCLSKKVMEQKQLGERVGSQLL